MKAAILIQAHKNPQQVARMCNALAHPDIDIFMHLDSKTDIAPFRALMPHITMIKERVRVLWGDFSQVEATLRGLREIKNTGMHYDYISLISGQDYPLITTCKFLKCLENGNKKEYLSHQKIDLDKRPDVAKRIKHYHFYLRNRTVTLFLRKLIYILSPFRRTYPTKNVYKGAQWWTLTMQCVDYILDYTEHHPKFVAFHRYTSCSDEMFFHNIVMQSPFVAKAVNNAHRYIDWSQHKANPKTLTVEDYNNIVKSEAWFARKFDSELDSNILDMLDKHLSEQQIVTL